MTLTVKDHVMIAAAGLTGHCQNFPRLLDLSENDKKALEAWLYVTGQYCDKVVEAINVANRTLEGRFRS